MTKVDIVLDSATDPVLADMHILTVMTARLTFFGGGSKPSWLTPSRMLEDNAEPGAHCGSVISVASISVFFHVRIGNLVPIFI